MSKGSSPSVFTTPSTPTSRKKLLTSQTNSPSPFSNASTPGSTNSASVLQPSQLSPNSPSVRFSSERKYYLPPTSSSTTTATTTTTMINCPDSSSMDSYATTLASLSSTSTTISSIDAHDFSIPPPPPPLGFNSPKTPKSPRFRPTAIIIPPASHKLFNDGKTLYIENNPTVEGTEIPNRRQRRFDSEDDYHGVRKVDSTDLEVEDLELPSLDDFEQEDLVYDYYLSDNDMTPQPSAYPSLKVLPTFYTPSHVNLVFASNLKLPSDNIIPENRIKTPRTPKTPSKAVRKQFNRSPSDEMLLLTNAHRSPTEILRGRYKNKAFNCSQFQI